jgi:hypothetical protein
MATMWGRQHIGDRRRSVRPYDMATLQFMSFALGVALLIALGFLVYFGG